MRIPVLILLGGLVLLLLLHPCGPAGLRDDVPSRSLPAETGEHPPSEETVTPPPAAPAPATDPGEGASPAPSRRVIVASSLFALRPADVVLAPALKGADLGLTFTTPGSRRASLFPFEAGSHIRLSSPQEGPAEIEIAAIKDGVLVRAKQRITLASGTNHLDPPLRLEPGAGVRVRVVDASGEPVPHVRILVARPEEKPGPEFPVAPGPGGWITYADLEPGVDHRVVVYGLPDPIERTVRVPPEPHGIAKEEIRLSATLVPVKITFTRGGESFDPLEDKEGEAGPTEVHLVAGGKTVALPLPDRMIPGRYVLRVGRFEGRLFVPATDRFETTVELSVHR